MDYSPILAPVVALVAWTLVVMLWMVVARGREFRRMGVTFGNIPPGSRGTDLEGRANPSAQWKSHNYNHLMEQPTIFYAIALTLAIIGEGTGVNAYAAWAYVVLRILHSIVQATVNIVAYRFALFALASLCLLFLAFHAAAHVFGFPH